MGLSFGMNKKEGGGESVFESIVLEDQVEPAATTAIYYNCAHSVPTSPQRTTRLLLCSTLLYYQLSHLFCY